MRTCANCQWKKEYHDFIGELSGTKPFVKEDYPHCWDCEGLGDPPDGWTRRRWVTLLTIILAVALILGAAFALTCWLASIDPRHNARPSGREVPRTIVLTNRHYVRRGKHPRWIVTRATVIDFYHAGYRMTEVGK